MTVWHCRNLVLAYKKGEFGKLASLEELKQQRKETHEEISAIKHGGQEVQTRNGRYKMADLGILRAEKADLERQISAAESAGSAAGNTFGTPMFYCGRG